MRILKTLLLLCIFLIADPIEIHVEKNKNHQIKMCKTKGKIVNNVKELIKIDMK